ncbi:hypothetical protein [Actinoplanes sp. M2I2]|uniref:LmrA/YxaF family transcription factor n=1 Tax=Actinoplanes sp. M2I2 TaxID=1734444 RepID=UPI0035ADBFD0
MRAWADAAIEHQEHDSGRGDCTLTSLAGELSPTDEQAREDLCDAFLRWQGLLHYGLRAMRETIRVGRREGGRPGVPRSGS